jgi:type IV pilus assembly protein PilE
MSTDGYSLVELLLVLIITGLLLTIAIPTYSHHITKIKRQDGKTALLELSLRLEAFYSENNTYATATIGQHKNTDVLQKSESPQGFYQLKILQQTNATYVIQATPIQNKFNDDSCGTLQLNELGEKSVSGGKVTGGSIDRSHATDGCW